MKYILDDTWVNDSTITIVPDGATELTTAEWDARFSEPYVKTALDIQIDVNETSLAYLRSTDWLLIRELDGGTPMTAEVKQLRVTARASIEVTQ